MASTDDSGPRSALALTVPERTGRVVAEDLEIRILGTCRVPSPLSDRLPRASIHYVGKADRVLLDDRRSRLREFSDDLVASVAAQSGFQQFTTVGKGDFRNHRADFGSWNSKT